MGDIRVGLAESPDKIQKLVQSGGGGRGRGGEEGGGRVTMLHGMYEPHLKKFSVEERGEEGGRIKFVQRKEREEFERLVGSLPSSVLSQMDCGWKSNTENNVFFFLFVCLFVCLFSTHSTFLLSGKSERNCPCFL